MLRRALPINGLVRPMLLLLLALLATLAAAGAALAAPYGRVAHNPADRLAAKVIDDYRYDERMGPYSACRGRKGRKRKVDNTTAHRDHVHIGLNWAGARKRTSFWRR